MKKIALLLLTLFFAVAGYAAGSARPSTDAVAKNLVFDKITGTVSYELTVPAHVRIRIGLADGPMCRTICDWQERGVGKHLESWDGKDTSGTEVLTGRNGLIATFNYFTAGGGSDSEVSFGFPATGNNAPGKSSKDIMINLLHKNHPCELCHEVAVELTAPAGTPATNDGFYIIDKKTTITMTVGDKDFKHFRAERFSAYFFIDNVYVAGEIEGYSPCNWIFDPGRLNKGKHWLTVNLIGYNDHDGVAVLPIVIR